MRFLRRLAFVGPAMGLMALALTATPARAADSGTDILQFPFANPCVLDRMAAFGVPDWSGDQPHNGIDLIIPEGLASAMIVAPAEGTVTGVETTENPFSNPPGAIMVSIGLEIDREYMLNLVIEPGTTDPVLKNAQEAAVAVAVGQKVVTGAHLADLLQGEMGYAHLHFMLLKNREPVCAYKYSTLHAKYAYDYLASNPDSFLPDGRICYGEP